eukprot:3610725-Rhodomonas_salina.2
MILARRVCGYQAKYAQPPQGAPGWQVTCAVTLKCLEISVFLVQNMRNVYAGCVESERGGREVGYSGPRLRGSMVGESESGQGRVFWSC